MGVLYEGGVHWDGARRTGMPRERGGGEERSGVAGGAVPEP